MKAWIVSAALALAACGGAKDDAANRAEAATSSDAVTAEAVRDTQAAEVDALKAADAELDNLSNTIDDAPSKGTGPVAKSRDAVSNSTKVTVY